MQNRLKASQNTEAAAAPNYKIEKSLKNNSQNWRTFTNIKRTSQYVILNFIPHKFKNWRDRGGW